MNCWFCNSQIDVPDLSFRDISCTNSKCHPYNVVYKFTNNNSLIVVQMRTQLNNHKYIVNYWMDLKRIIVVEQLPAPYSYEKVLEIPCECFPINPNNVNDKLSLFLLLS